MHGIVASVRFTNPTLRSPFEPNLEKKERQSFMAGINVEKLSLKELQDLEVRVKKAIVGAKNREQDEFRADVIALAAKRGISVGEVFGGGKSSKGGKVAVKYRNPNDPSETWTGRGRQPKWLAAAIKKGAKIDDFAI